MGDSLSFFLVVFVFESGVGGEEEEVREEEREALEELGKLDQIQVQIQFGADGNYGAEISLQKMLRELILKKKERKKERERGKMNSRYRLPHCQHLFMIIAIVQIGLIRNYC